MTNKTNSMVEIHIETDEEAMKILNADADVLAKALKQFSAELDIAQIGGAPGTRDAATVIIATASLVAASTPIITQIISAFFINRGIKVKLKADAKSGTITYEASRDK